MASNYPPPIPFHSKPTRSTAPIIDEPHRCNVCKDTRRFPYEIDRCPFTGGDLSYRLGRDELKRRLKGDDRRDGSDSPVRLDGEIYCKYDTVMAISRWIMACMVKDCAGYDQGRHIKDGVFNTATII